MRIVKTFLMTSLLAIGACSVAPAPDYAIKVVPAADGQTARAIPPACPRWSDNDLNFFDNQPMPQFGCADARNMAMMVDRPEDLLQGREMGPSRGVLTSGAILRYDSNQTRGLLAPSQQPDNSADATTAPVANSGLSGETPPSSSGPAGK